MNNGDEKGCSSSYRSDRIRIQNVETLANDWTVLRKYTFCYQRRDGIWQQLCREVYHRGDRAAVLLYCRQRGTIVLTRQLRLPVFIAEQHDGMLIEAPGGLLDISSAADAVSREVEEETGLRITHSEEVFTAYMSPHLTTERYHFFIAEFDPDNRLSVGGGSMLEGEDIEVLEFSLDDAIAGIERGEIVDGKTIILLYHAKLKGLLDN